MSITLLPEGSTVRLISLKEPDQPPPRDVVTVITSTNEVFATGKPSTKPKLVAWEVLHGEGSGVLFKNVETGKYLSSSLPFFKVNVVENIDDGCIWELFNKVSGTLIPATSLEGVYVRNKHTTGFLSVRSNEGWTPPGKLWTRDSKNQPASSFSWECFTIINQKHEESPTEENEHLKEQLRLAQLQIKQLQDEVGKLKEYKEFFELFRKLSQK
eukprot:TRINITY_DN3608_c0_g1_i25.p1 TRINITY_DN3608_c0_g1~~TRINITY_DN3608_c0_g1_i25.p1  ORF type:complete len:213 (-),score=42.62 TRINITY_DN3608_c0_g1_i25:78-716(-)